MSWATGPAALAVAPRAAAQPTVALAQRGSSVGWGLSVAEQLAVEPEQVGFVVLDSARFAVDSARVVVGSADSVGLADSVRLAAVGLAGSAEFGAGSSELAGSEPLVVDSVLPTAAEVTFAAASVVVSVSTVSASAPSAAAPLTGLLHLLVETTHSL